MFISTMDLFKLGIGPSSSHTMGPMLAANQFIKLALDYLTQEQLHTATVECQLKGSLAYTGRGHATDSAVLLGLHGNKPNSLLHLDIDVLVKNLSTQKTLELSEGIACSFDYHTNLIFDTNDTLPQHPNGMVFRLLDGQGKELVSERYFSIGGGFVSTLSEIEAIEAPIRMMAGSHIPHPFETADQMLLMAEKRVCSVAQMKLENELSANSDTSLNGIHTALDDIWCAMKSCLEKGLHAQGILPGGLKIKRRAKELMQQLQSHPEQANINDWLCTYAIAVNEENAAGHSVVTAPTNGAAGVIPAVLYYFIKHENGSLGQVRDFLLTAGAIGGLIKHNSSISGAEVGCQGEVGSASAMAAAGLCAAKGGTPRQVENAAEIALEHHLGMTCDPVAGLVQVPCIERNGFGAIKAYAASSLALRGSGYHFMSLDNCIAAMKQTGLEMSEKYKETALGGLAVSYTEC